MTKNDKPANRAPAESQLELGLWDNPFSSLSSAGTEQCADLSDGCYQARIEQVHLRRTPRTGKPMLLWRLRITGPRRKGERLTKTRVITPKTLPFVKEDLERCGVQLQRFADLEFHLHEMEGQVVTVTGKRNRAGWLDVTFAKRTSQTSPPRLGGSLPERGNDDLPF